VSRRHTSPKRLARKAMRQARRQQVAWRRERDRGLSAAGRIERQFSDAGVARHARDRKEPV
jgi:hypothetical protein